MNKTGQIVQITPAGGYQSQNGYINTFQMTLQCPDGTFTGEIGAKSQQYPMNVGDTINVTVTNDQYGMKFKKFNPQYAGQGGQPEHSSVLPASVSPPQYPHNTQNKPQEAAQSTNRDFDKENHGKCFTLLMGATLQSGVGALALTTDPETIKALANLATMCMNSYDFRTPKADMGNPNF